MIQSAHLSIRRRYQISQLFVLLFLCGVILLLSQSGAGSLFAKRNAVNVSQVKSNQVHTAEASVVASPLATTDSSFWMNSLQKFISKRRKLFASFASSSSKKSTVVPTGSLATTSNNGNDAIFQLSESSTNVTKCVEEEKVVVWDYIQFLKLGSAVILVCLSGLFSGLTLGLLGLDKTTLDIIKNSGKENHRKWAARIIPIRKRGNLLLCTLLLGNVMVNTGISVLTTDMTSGIAGFLISSAVITLFGEIIPQATCSRYALAIGAHTFWLVYIFMALLFPLTFPLSFFLDKVLGKEIGTVYTKEELKRLVEIHVTTLKQESDLLEDEARILGGVLDFSKKKVEDIMTHVESTFMLDVSEKLDVDTMTKIWQTGHSRVPVYKNNRDNIVGVLFTKDLVLINPEEGVPLSTVLTFYGREVIKVFPDTKLDEMLKVFKSGRSHLAIVHDVHTPKFGDPVYQTVGLVSLEDLIEEMIKDEIVDETDVYIDNTSKNKVERDNERIEITLFAGRGQKHRATPKQVVAIASYLEKTIDLFRCVPEDYLQKLIGMSPLFEIDNTNCVEDIFIYESSKPTDFFALILNGRVEVLSGKDSFSSELGMWSYLGIRALSEPSFTPDFSARVLKPTVFLKIARNDFIDLVTKAYRNDVHNYLPREIQWIAEKEESLPRRQRPTDESPTSEQITMASVVEASHRHRGMSDVATPVNPSVVLTQTETTEVEVSAKGALLPQLNKKKRKKKGNTYRGLDDDSEEDDDEDDDQV